MKRVAGFSFLFVLLTLAFGDAGGAGDAMTGATWAYRSRDYEKAHRLWLAEANAGNAETRDRLGWPYENGEGSGVRLKKRSQNYKRVVC